MFSSCGYIISYMLSIRESLFLRIVLCFTLLAVLDVIHAGLLNNHLSFTYRYIFTSIYFLHD